jgi:hypothetical protein
MEFGKRSEPTGSGSGAALSPDRPIPWFGGWLSCYSDSSGTSSIELIWSADGYRWVKLGTAVSSAKKGTLFLFNDELHLIYGDSNDNLSVATDDLGGLKP